MSEKPRLSFWQILASVGLGSVVKHRLGEDAMKAVLMGGAGMLIAGLVTPIVSASETGQAIEG